MPSNTPIGKLRVIAGSKQTSKKIYHLQKGKNIIGRKSPEMSEDVNICIDTDDRTMSRRHCQIIIAPRGPNKYAYVISVLKKQLITLLFDTKRRKMEVEFGDEIYLSHQYCIQLGDTELRLEIPQPKIKTTR